MGLQVQDRRSTDIPSFVNSTPVVGGGFVFHTGGKDYYTGLRLLHISNAHTQSSNAGQNQLCLMLGVRY